jgi:curved DNA-binding protein
MSAVADPYKTLGLAHDCTLADVKASYRKLARKNHPDMSKAAGAEARFKDIAQAYATLKDPAKRAEYDESLLVPKAPPWANHAYQAESGRSPFDDMDLADLMASMGRGNAQPRRPVRRDGEDMEHTVYITLAEASAGTTMMLDVLDGSVRRSLEVKIPAGVLQGRRVRLSGMGGKGSNGGDNGSIYLNVQLKPDKMFHAKGHDLSFDLRISPWEALLGAQIQVETLTGEVVLTVPAFTQASQTLRLKGRGMQDGKGGAGDLYARVNIVVPSSLTAAQLALVEQLSKLSTFDPRNALR